jgi:hypothetical protein
MGPGRGTAQPRHGWLGAGRAPPGPSPGRSSWACGSATPSPAASSRSTTSPAAVPDPTSPPQTRSPCSISTGRSGACSRQLRSLRWHQPGACLGVGLVTGVVSASCLRGQRVRSAAPGPRRPDQLLGGRVQPGQRRATLAGQNPRYRSRRHPGPTGDLVTADPVQVTAGQHLGHQLARSGVRRGPGSAGPIPQPGLAFGVDSGDPPVGVVPGDPHLLGHMRHQSTLVADSLDRSRRPCARSPGLSRET